MDITTSTHNVDIVVATTDGRLDALEAAKARMVLTELIDAGRNRMVIDLSAVEFVDSAGLAALIQAMKRSRSTGGDVRLVKPSDPRAYRVFELTKFDQVFDFGDTAEDLVRGW